MKKILAFLLCVTLMLTLSFGVYAEDVPVDEGEQPPAEETPDETPGDTPGTEIPDETPSDNEKPDSVIKAEQITEKIVNYVKEHFEDWMVLITMLVAVWIEIKKRTALTASVGTMNNNAVTMAQTSSETIAASVATMNNVSTVVEGYKQEVENLLKEVRANEEEKHKLAAALTEVNMNLQTSKAANIEFANELAELLVLANIPNSKKDELYARHRAAVAAISEAEKTEVKENVGQEA